MSTTEKTELSKLSFSDIFQRIRPLGAKIETGQELSEADASQLRELATEVMRRHHRKIQDIDTEYGGDKTDLDRKAEIDEWLSISIPIVAEIVSKAAVWGLDIGAIMAEAARVAAGGGTKGEAEIAAAAAAAAEQARAEMAGQIEQQVDALRAQLEELNTKIAELQAEVNQLQANKAQLTGEKSELEAQNAQLRGEKTGLETQIQALQAQADQEKQKTYSLFDAKEQSIAALQQELYQLRADLNGKNGQIGAAAATELAIQQALENAGVLLSPSQSPLDGLGGLVQKAKLADAQRTELAENAQALTTLQQQLTEKERVATTLLDEKGRLAQKIEDLMSKAQQAGTDHESGLRELTERHKGQLDTLNDRLTKTSEKLRESETNEDQQASQIRALEARASAAETSARDKDTLLARKSEELNKKDLELTDALAQIAQLTGALEESKAGAANVDQLTEKVALLEAELASQKALNARDAANAEQKDQAVPKLESLIEVSKEKLATLLKIDQNKVTLMLNSLFIPYIKANGQIPRSRINQMAAVPEKDLVASGQWDSLKTNTITVLFGEIVKSIVLPAHPNFLEKDTVHAFLRTATNNPDIIAFKKGVLKIIIQQPN